MDGHLLTLLPLMALIGGEVIFISSLGHKGERTAGDVKMTNVTIRDRRPDLPQVLGAGHLEGVHRRARHPGHERVPGQGPGQDLSNRRHGGHRQNRNDLESLDGAVILQNIERLTLEGDLDWKLVNERIRSIENVELLVLPKGYPSSRC
jgi:hypothetical protein